MTKKIFFMISIAILSLSLLIGTSQTFAESTLEWTSKENLPAARAGMASVVYDGKIYTFGGSSNAAFSYLGTKHNNTFVYDPTVNTWEEKRPMPYARSAASAVVVNDKIYVIGGHYNAGSTLAMSGAVEIYDPANDSWTSGPSLLTARSWSAAVKIENSIYVFGGGIASGTATNTVEKLDLQTNTWTKISNMPYSSSTLKAAQVNGRTFILGGTSYPTTYDSVWEYVAESDSYLVRKNMLIAKSTSAIAVQGNTIFVLGDGVTSEAYNTTTDEWTSFVNLTFSRSELSAATINDTIYVMGGTTGATNGIFNSVEALTLAESANPPTPEPTPTPIPTPTPTQQNGDRAILVITMTTGLEREYDLSMQEVNDFINWYEAKQTGSGTASYAIDKHDNNKGPFKSRKDYILFDRILTFEVSEY